MSGQRFTAAEVAQFLRGAFTGETIERQDEIEAAFRRLVNSGSAPGRAGCRIKLKNGQQFRLRVVEIERGAGKRVTDKRVP